MSSATARCLESMNLTFDYDSPWKEALRLYLRSFVRLCFPQVEQAIDWSREPEFLDKELQQIIRDAEAGRKYVDMLVKVWLLDGSATHYETEVLGTRGVHLDTATSAERGHSCPQQRPRQEWLKNIGKSVGARGSLRTGMSALRWQYQDALARECGLTFRCASC